MSDMEHMYSNLIRTIKKTAEEVGMYAYNNSHKKDNPWFDWECRKGKNHLNSCLHKCIKTTYSEKSCIDEFIKSRNYYRTLIKLKKKNFIGVKIDALAEAKSSKVFWKNLNSFRKVKVKQNPISMDKWFEFFMKSQPLRNEYQIISTHNTVSYLDKDIDIDELELSLMNSKLGKSPGVDEITNDFYKSLPCNWKLYLLIIFNKIMMAEAIPETWAEVMVVMLFKKGNLMNPENYRPISLVNSITKIFTGILNNRIVLWCEKNNLLPEFQSGFRSSRGCIDNIFVLNSIIQMRLQKPKEKLFAIFIDFKQAFTSVNHAILWNKLRVMGLSTKMLNIIISIYKNSQMYVKKEGVISQAIPITVGVLQGEILSPTLFALFISDFEEFLRERGCRGVSMSLLIDILTLAYADDLVVLSESSAGMKTIIKALWDYCKINKLSINIKKTKIIIFKKGVREVSKLKFYFGESEIEVVREYTYLGIPFYYTGLYEKATKSICYKSQLATNATVSLLKTTRIESWRKVVEIFESLVTSTLIFASPVWSLNYLSELEKIQLQFFKKLLHLPLNTPSYAIRIDLDRPHIALKIFRITLKWLKKVSNMHDDRFPKVCLKKLLNNISSINNISKYNWLSQLNNTFFSVINEIIPWNNFETFFSLLDIDAICKKYERILRFRDIERTLNSTSLMIFPELSKHPAVQVLSENPDININTFKVFIQVRLLNYFNQRIIVDGRVYKFKGATVCNYCNVQVDTFLHILADCLKYENIRKSFFLNNKQDICIPNAFISEINNLNIGVLDIKNLVNYVKIILKKESDRSDSMIAVID